MFRAPLLIFPVIAMARCEFFTNTKGNLTEITWAHAVNNASLLEKALEENVMMLEADVSLGKLSMDKSNKIIPIMAHPPNNVSDLSLEQFLTNVTQHNRNNTQSSKGVKLDFKSIEAFNASVPILKKVAPTVQYPLWLNADILPGPVNATTEPVNAAQFLQGSKQFPNSTLSIGWTTYLAPNSSFNNSYSSDQITAMLSTIAELGVNQSVTFPVRAGFAAESLSEMKKLLENVTDSTLTIWSSENDPVNVDRLRELILDLGVDKVYVDVPQKLREELHLGSSGNRAGNVGNIFSVVLATLVMIFVTKIL